MTEALAILDQEPGRFSFACHRNLLIVSWLAQATAPAALRLTGVARKLVRVQPLGFSAVHVIHNGAAMPDGDARTAFKQMLKEFNRELACLAVVVGGDGFWAGALRAVVTGIWQSGTHSFETRICGSHAEVASWLPPRHAQRTGTNLDPVTLVALLDAAPGATRSAHATPGL